MNSDVEYFSNLASASEIAEHLLSCDMDFVPPLSGRLEIGDYADKLANKAETFEAWSDSRLVGLVAAYSNFQDGGATFITSVSVTRTCRGRGIANRLLGQCISMAKTLGARQIELEVNTDNFPAIALYLSNGFVSAKQDGAWITMQLQTYFQSTP